VGGGSLIFLSVFVRHQGQGGEKDLSFGVFWFGIVDCRCLVEAPGRGEEEFCAGPRTGSVHGQGAGGV
jgi:hypothetical protein